jgi:hypothetical protein
MIRMARMIATRAGAWAHAYLSAGRRAGCVVSVFRHGATVLLDAASDPALVAVQSPAVPLHPWAVEVSDPPALRVGTGCEAAGLTIGLSLHLRIDLEPARVERLPMAPWNTEDAQRARQRIPELRRLVEQAHGAVNRSLGDLKGELNLGASVEDWGTTLAARLIGRGGGSTPSGDDYVIGRLAVLHVLQAACPPAARQLRDFDAFLASCDITSRTPLGSAQMLAAAAEGGFAEPILRMMIALAKPLQPGIGDAAHVLSKQGASSGIATLWGIADGLAQAATFDSSGRKS